MSLGPTRWHVLGESNFPWEREALEWLRTALPDLNPWHAWPQFEFIDEEGKVNQVDVLVLSPAGLFLVEIKSRPGILRGDSHTWVWETDGRRYTYDNPLLLANHKSKRLASLLRRQTSSVRSKLSLPFIQPLIFLSATTLSCRLEGPVKAAVFQRGRPNSVDDPGIVSALAHGLPNQPFAAVDRAKASAIFRALTEAGIRPSNKHRQVGDYQLNKLLLEGEGFQDWEAQHVSVDTVRRRVRLYTVAKAISPDARASRFRQARRQFEILEGIDHPGILKVKDYTETELGPALIFDLDSKEQRLDHLLRNHGATLTVSQRLQLIRDIAETLQFAHSKRLYHRALGPQSVLVRADANAPLRVRLMNWHTGSRNASDSASDTVHRTTGTRHVEEYVEEPQLVYLAPESIRGDLALGASLDVFSLGCIAYHLFSGCPPASSVLELTEKLRVGLGLRLSDVLDGCGARQQELIQFATNPNVLARYETIKEFLDQLDRVEEELTTPDPEDTVDPSIAKANDRLEGGFTVVRRVGRGSSSDVLLVRRDGSAEEHILKVASDVAHNARLIAEGDALNRLHHSNIVAHRETLSIAGRTALLLKSAGPKTLAHLLKEQGRLSLDMLQSFGEELLQAVNHLENEGIAHRDIKPENIGIAQTRTGKHRAILLDFSLSRTAPENISAGTHPYLDPFLSLRRPPRWDLYAERFALAVTLYEMAVGCPPVWGDGQTLPSLLEVEATIQSDVFDPVTRQGFTAFFQKALRRDYRERFDNAEDMLRAWREIFLARETLHPADTDSDEGIAAIAMAATAQSTMAELGYSLEAQDALERIGIHNARELLTVDRIRFRILRGVGDKVRKEIRFIAKELARLRPDLAKGHGTAYDAEDGSDQATSINELASLLLPRRPAGDDRPEEAALLYYLGLEDNVPAGTWPSIGATAQFAQVERGTLTTTLVKARERWLKIPPLTELRAQLATLLSAQGQVMSAREAAMALLALRGCAQQDDLERLRQATAVLRASVEAEAHLDKPRFEAFDHQPAPLIASSAPWAEYARHLGIVADACCAADPLLPPTRALETLQAIAAPGAMGDGTQSGPALPPTRLLRLATSASLRAALSSRQEIYPRRMPAIQALRQSLGALVGAPQLRPRDIQDRVKGRYPEAIELPERPELDRLLEEVGAPLEWDPVADKGLGAYRVATLGRLQAAGTTTELTRKGTLYADRESFDGAPVDLIALEQRLRRNLRQGGLLVLTVQPRVTGRAEAKLLQMFGEPQDLGVPTLKRLSFDAMFFRELRAQALAANVDWSLVIQADATKRHSRDWVNLQRLVQRTVPTLRNLLLHSPVPLLVVNCGLLARYDLLTLVTEMETAAGRPGQTPAIWLLLPSNHQGLPTIDGVAVPLINNIHGSRTVPLPKAWALNGQGIDMPNQNTMLSRNRVQ